MKASPPEMSTTDEDSDAAENQPATVKATAAADCSWSRKRTVTFDERLEGISKLLAQVLQLLLAKKCHVSDDTYLELVISGLKDEVQLVTGDELRTTFVTRSGIMDFIQKSGNGNNDNEKVLDFRYKLMENLYDSVTLVKERARRECELNMAAHKGCKAFLDLVIKVICGQGLCQQDEDRIHAALWNDVIKPELQSDDVTNANIFWSKSFQTLAVKVAAVQTRRQRDYVHLDQLVSGSANGCQLSSSILIDLLDLNRLKTNPCAIHLSSMAADIMAALPMLVQAKILIKLKDVEKLSALIELSEERREKLSKEEYKEWMNVVKMASPFVPVSLLEKLLESNPRSRHLVVHLHALTTISKPDLVDNAVMDFLARVKDEIPDGLLTDALTAATSTLAHLPDPKLRPATFQLLAKTSTAPTLPLEIKVSCLEVIKKRRFVAGVTLKSVLTELWSHGVTGVNWKVKDLFVSIVCDVLESAKAKAEPSQTPLLMKLMKSGLEDSSSFVRSSSVRLLGIMLETGKAIEDEEEWDFQAALADIVANDTEAIVRRAAFKVLALDLEVSRWHLISREAVQKIFLEHATNDFDWEVREIAAEFWAATFHRKKKAYLTLEEFALFLTESGLSRGAVVTEQDVDDKRRLHTMYKLQADILHFMQQRYGDMVKEYSAFLREKATSRHFSTGDYCVYNVVEQCKRQRICLDDSDDYYDEEEGRGGRGCCPFETCFINPMNVSEADSLTVLCPRAKLVSTLLTTDYEPKLEEFDDYCDMQQGLSSVLQDILQSASAGGQIDLIDCV